MRLETIPGVSVPYVHFHPTLAPFLTRDLPPEQRAALETRYWQAYYEFADYLYQSDRTAPHEVRALAARELPNLKAGLRLALAAAALDEAVGFADRINRFLDVFGRWRERDEVVGWVEKAVTRNGVTRNSKGITHAEVLMESGRGERLLQMGRAGEAEGVFRALLGRLEAGAAYDARFNRASTLGNVGRALRAQGKPSEAARFHRLALEAWAQLEQTEQVRRATSTDHCDLSDVLRDMGQYAAARQEYEASLEINKQAGEERNSAATLGQLGTLALAQNDLAEARRLYLEALAVFRGMGEAQMEAVAWHQLGMVAEEGRDWDEAERCYKESIAIRERLHDLAGAAQTCNQLAFIAKKAGRPTEAERWARQALSIKQKLDNPKQLATGHHMLGSVLSDLGKLDEAADHLDTARKLYEMLDASENMTKMYAALAELAERRGRPDEARRWRCKEQETFAAFAGSEVEIRQFESLMQAVVLAARGDRQALAFVEGEHPKMEASGGGWEHVADEVRRVLAGERDAEHLTEGLNRTQALIVRRILAMLDAPSSPTPSPSEGEGGPETEPAPAEGEGLTLPQLLDLVERAVRGDRQLGGQLFEAMRQLAGDPSQPPELRALGKALTLVLVGDTSPSLDGLPPELASAVRGLLARVRG